MGVNLNLHYCHGEVDSISFFVEDGSCICDEAFPDRMDKMTCCFDKNYKYELDTDHVISSTPTFNFEISDFFIQPIYSFENLFLEVYKITINTYNIPPPDILQGLPLRILYSVFRL